MACTPSSTCFNFPSAGTYFAASHLQFHDGLSPAGCIFSAAGTAAVSAAVELYTPNGMDTITCPLAAMAVLLPLVALFGGIL